MKNLITKSAFIFIAMIGITLLMSESSFAAATKTFPLQEAPLSIDVKDEIAYLLIKGSEILKISPEGEIGRVRLNLELDRTEPEISQAQDLAIIDDKIVFAVGNSASLQVLEIQNPENGKPVILPVPGLEAQDQPIKLQRCGNRLLVETLHGVKKLFEMESGRLVEVMALKGILAGSRLDEPLCIEVSGPPENLTQWQVLKGKTREMIFSIAAENKAENIQNLQILGNDREDNFYFLLTQGPAEQNTSTWLVTAKDGREIRRQAFVAVPMQEMVKSDVVTSSGTIFSVRKATGEKDENWGKIYLVKP